MKKNKRITKSLIITVFNEEETIEKLIKSVVSQTIIPDEFIIADGLSTDNTCNLIIKKANEYKNIIKIKLIKVKGNRSIGRNAAIKKAKGEIILCTDAGCVLDKNWVKNITAPFKDKSIDVVSGYYKGLPKNELQKALVPYVLVMSNKIDKENFLPATRSIAFKKRIWEKISGFNNNLSHNEDYDFAIRLKKYNAKIVFAKNAIVNWIPRSNLKQSFKMFYRFAFGDGEMHYFRPTIFYLYLRYFLAFYLLILSYLYKSLFPIFTLILFFLFYIFLIINKNKKYIKTKKGLFFSIVIQILSDIAVIIGTTLGVLKSIIHINIKKIVLKNKLLVFLILLYSTLLISVIGWGIPGSEHPFLYHMDEWHQLQSVKNVFKYGSPNMDGSANGTMFHFFLSGLYLIPFVLFKIIDPFSIKSAVDNLSMQASIFTVLRLNTMLFGLLTIIIVNKISKLLKINTIIAIFLFVFNPLWLMLSNHFKYDIALMFWFTFSIYLILKYCLKPTPSNFIIAGIFSAVAISVKVSVLPIIFVYIFSFLFFNSKFKYHLKTLFLGLTLLIVAVFLLGIPDFVFSNKNIGLYLYQNLVTIPSFSQDINLGYSYFEYVFFYHFPTIFGHFFYLIFLISFFFLFTKTIIDIVRGKKDKLLIFILISLFIFLLSLIPLRYFITGSRALVLIPFMVIIVGIFISRVKTNKTFLNKLLIVLFLIIMVFQFIESFFWISLKYMDSPQRSASLWITKNIPIGKVIGIENIPIYQFEPDIVLLEFYDFQYGKTLTNNYKYALVDESVKKLPDIIIISNSKLALEHEINTPKKFLIQRLLKENYVKKIEFNPYFKFYDLFGNTFNYMYSGLIAAPYDLSIYIKK